MEIKDKLELINRTLEENVKIDRDIRTYEAAFNASNSEGKRYRSLLSLEIYEMLGGAPKDFLKSTSGIEFLHTSSLILDDLPCMDNSQLRRGKPATHVEFGEHIAILAGAYLLSRGEYLLHDNAAEHLTQYRLSEANELIHDSIKSIILGQELDLRDEKTDKELKESLLQKNWAFHFSCVLPAYLLKKEDYRETLGNIGTDLSIAYQLLDDLRDIEGTEKDTGKPVHVEKERNTTVYRYGPETVKQEIKQKKTRIIKNIRKIKKNSQLENLINEILTKY